MKKILLGAVFAAMALPVLAAQNDPAGTLGISSDQPIAVNADNFTADLNAETGTYTGNVIVVQGQVKLRANEVTVAAPGGKASRMEARGNVVVDSPSGIARGTTAVYDVPGQVIRMAGPVVLTKDQNVMRGNALVVEVASGRARLTGGAAAQGGQGTGGGRVQGLFVPQTRSQTPPPQTPPNP
jgi:lipopolysaccharide export system protein LptA